VCFGLRGAPGCPTRPPCAWCTHTHLHCAAHRCVPHPKRALRIPWVLPFRGAATLAQCKSVVVVRSVSHSFLRTGRAPATISTRFRGDAQVRRISEMGSFRFFAWRRATDPAGVLRGLYDADCQRAGHGSSGGRRTHPSSIIGQVRGTVRPGSEDGGKRRGVSKKPPASSSACRCVERPRRRLVRPGRMPLGHEVEVKLCGSDYVFPGGRRSQTWFGWSPYHKKS
jgi:hypothetical protein